MSENEVNQLKECIVAYLDKDGQPASREGDHKLVWDHSNGWFTQKRCTVCGMMKPAGERFEGQ